MLPLLLACAVAAEDAGPTPAEVAHEPDLPPLHDGDLVFHASASEQARFLRVATGSTLTHVGLIDVRGDEAWVVEAVQPVRVTRLAAFRDRYGDPRVAVKRVPGLDDADRASVVKQARKWVGGDYDRRFDWSDARMYCSELVWKAYDRALGLQIAAVRTFGDHALFRVLASTDFARARWGDGGPDPAMKVVSPADLFAAEESFVVVDQL